MLNGSKGAKIFARSLKVGFVCRFLCFERSEPNRFAINCNDTAPRFCGASVMVSALKESASLYPGRSIAAILLVRTISQIVPSIISFITISVVDFACWPRAGHIEPRQSSGEIVGALYKYPAVSSGYRTASDAPGWGASSELNFPMEEACIWIVFQESFKRILRHSFVFFRHTNSMPMPHWSVN